MATNPRNDPTPARTDWWKVAYKQQKQKKQQGTQYTPDDFWAYSFDKKRFSNVKTAPKFSIDEALTLSRNNYTSLFRAGSRETVGLVGTPWQQTAALYRLREGYNVPNLIYSPESQKQVLDMAAAKPIVFGGALYNTINDLNDQINNYFKILQGHAAILKKEVPAVEIRKRMVEYTKEKANANRNLLSFYFFLDIVALGILFYVYKAT